MVWEMSSARLSKLGYSTTGMQDKNGAVAFNFGVISDSGAENKCDHNME